jgi:hypothetical protein
MKRSFMVGIMLVVSSIGFGQRGNQSPAIDPPIHTVQTDGTLRIRLNGVVSDWLLGAGVAQAGTTAKVRVFEIDRDYKTAALKALGQGFAKAVTYPSVSVSANTAEINGVGSHDTSTVYVEAPPWTTIIVTGAKNEVLYQAPLRKTLLVSRGVELNAPTIGSFGIVLSPSDKTHEARLPSRPGASRSILQTKQLAIRP